MEELPPKTPQAIHRYGLILALAKMSCWQMGKHRTASFQIEQV
jgi:hypothetical protein